MPHIYLEEAKTAEELIQWCNDESKLCKRKVRMLQRAIKRVPKVRSEWDGTHLAGYTLVIYSKYWGEYIEIGRKVKNLVKNRKGILVTDFLKQEIQKEQKRCDKVAETAKELKVIAGIKDAPDITSYVKAMGQCRFCKQHKPVWAKTVDICGVSKLCAVICSDCYEKFCLLEMKKRVEGLRP